MDNPSSDPPIRVMALHALEYCERLFYLEEVEEIRVADSAVFAGRTLHEELRKTEEEDGEWSSVELASETIGLIGKTDCLRKRDGAVIPYEHKRGRCRREGKKATAWPSDTLQVLAYAAMLKEESDNPVPEGRIRYHADNVTVRVPFDDKAEEWVRNAVSRARELRSATSRPPVTSNDSLCIKCSLAPVCLPEEERLADNDSWEPIRLFPPERDAKTIHVLSHGARISRSGDTLSVHDPDHGDREYPINDVSSVVIHGYAQITTQAIHFLSRNGVSVSWISPGGAYVGGLLSDAGGVQRKIRQYVALCDEPMRRALSRRLAMAKVENSLRYILRSTRQETERKPEIMESLRLMRNSIKSIAKSEDADATRGHEGMAGKAYFAILPHLIKDNTPNEMRFSGRNRRPPKDRFNALLGFGYSLLYSAVVRAIIAVGLEPSLGFYHTPRSSAHPLALDLMELFRVPIWDIPLIGSVNRQQWDIDADFTITPGRVWLSESGRKKAIALFESRLDETWKHPVVNYSLSYMRLIELETRLLEKEWMGKPGLFARMRIR